MVESFTLTKNHGIQLFGAKNNENLEIINDQTKNDNSPLDILFLIPHPFYQDRGSPIADNLVLKFLSQQNDKIDVVTYPQGKDVDYKNTNIYRTIDIPFVKNVRPGFSWKKIIYDLLMFLEVARLLSKKRYSLIHAVEESVFIALLLKFLLNIPYIYDMDSSLSQQMIEKYPFISPFIYVLKWFEKHAVKNAEVVVPVCQALANNINQYQPKKVVLLPDISLLNEKKVATKHNLKKELKISNTMLMYVGNLEQYQGMDLLLDSFALALKQTKEVDLVIVGGEQEDIKKYQNKAKKLGIQEKVYFLGKKPASELGNYLAQADVLVSPRIKGKNTPMKIYSYLDSGKAVLATNLPTHTQVLDDKTAMLSHSNPQAFSKGIISLIKDPELRLKLGEAGKIMVQKKHSYAAFCEKLGSLYNQVKETINSDKNQNGDSEKKLVQSGDYQVS
ncbi:MULTISPECIES: glycosyltransferase family 4 protein [unclassified Okeania]|uniref:glycosyltransferase family 4 protein n=1 Tax=unclassified Okeania TaxID=2634635 RepID=UPI00257A6BE4|nr:MULTISPECIES: glycosyltransferase family 4 protein [unclassified Okeania]